MDSLSLIELNSLVRQSLEESMPDRYWMHAELSEVRQHSNGHCYLEFVQKLPQGNGLAAKARGVIWSNVYGLLRPYFEETTGQALTAGLQVLVQVEVSFHELYGYTLVVCDIDPAYTLGDLARRRREILLQLKEEGVLTLNQELSMPALPRRVAVISSATAAGYGDFCHQLQHNARGFAFTVRLFPAMMQGAQVEASVLKALDDILQRQDDFDVVVIIRGGGATSDLSCFDTYLLAAACAQFPLPIITGIGHERDETVLDSVAHVRVKTPTAAAEYLINRMEQADEALSRLALKVCEVVSRRLTDESQRLEQCRLRLPVAATHCLASARLSLLSVQKDVMRVVTSRLQQASHRLELLQQRVSDASPQKMLARGYSLTLKDGKAVTDASRLKAGDRLTTLFRHGQTESVVCPPQD